MTLEGADAGTITSAAEIPLQTGVHSFAIAMVRAEADARNLPLNYTVGAERWHRPPSRPYPVWKDRNMSDTPKFEVIDRRKYKAEEEEREAEASKAAGPESKPEPVPEAKKEEPRPGPQLVTEAPRPACGGFRRRFRNGTGSRPAPAAPTDGGGDSSAKDCV